MTLSTLPIVKLKRGIHLIHQFYQVDRALWAQLAPGESIQCRERVEKLCAAYAQPSHPRVCTYATVGGKADLAVIIYAAELGQLNQIFRDFEACFPPASLRRVFSYLSVTELSEYMATDEDNRQVLIEQEKLLPGSDAYKKRWEEIGNRKAEYEQYRLYPELPDWEVMGFYPMNKRRAGPDNWYLLDTPTRKRLMGGHARVGRKYSGRVVQLISGSTGLDDWEWGVTLVAHQADDLKEIVYEMRFDEVSARYADFGPFFINLRLPPNVLWGHLHL